MKHLITLLILIISINCYSQNHKVYAIDKKSKTVTIEEEKPKVTSEVNNFSKNGYKWSKMYEKDFNEKVEAFIHPETGTEYALTMVFTNAKRPTGNFENVDIKVFKDSIGNELIYYPKSVEL